MYGCVCGGGEGEGELMRSMGVGGGLEVFIVSLVVVRCTWPVAVIELRQMQQIKHCVHMSSVLM